MAIRYLFGFNGQLKDNEIYGEGNAYTAEFWEYDPRSIRRWNRDPVVKPWISPYHAFSNKLLTHVDPGGAVDDWVQNNKTGEIKWDDNATSQATTQKEDTYLGKDLVFVFNSYINSSYDGPKPPWNILGNKLSSMITINSTKNADGSLKSVDVKSDYIIHATSDIRLFKGRDYFPGLGKDQNKSINISGARSFNATFEQHTSVPGIEAFGLSLLSQDIVNVAQQMTISLTGNQLSISAYTDIFPSADLFLKGSGNSVIYKLMQYDQPSFKTTHSKSKRFEDNGMGGVDVITESVRPSPALYLRYPQKE